MLLAYALNKAARILYIVSRAANGNRAHFYVDAANMDRFSAEW